MTLFNIIHRTNTVREQILEDDTEEFNELFKIDCFNTMDSPDSEDDIPKKPIDNNNLIESKIHPAAQPPKETESLHSCSNIPNIADEEEEITTTQIPAQEKVASLHDEERLPVTFSGSLGRTIRSFESKSTVSKETFFRQNSPIQFWKVVNSSPEKIRTFEPVHELKKPRVHPVTFDNPEKKTRADSTAERKQSEPSENVQVIDTNMAIIWNNKGVVFSKMGNYSQAIRAYDQALLVDPDNARIWNNKGVVLTRLGRYQEAIEAYNQALILDADYSQVWNNRGIALTRLGKYQEAIEAYDQALRMRTDCPVLYENQAVPESVISTRT